MKSTTILLSLAVLLILAGCQIAKAPENGAVEEEAQPEVVTEESAEPETEEGTQAAEDSQEEVFVNPNYDAKLDGDPTQKPASEKDEEEKEDDDKDNYVPFIVPEPEKE